MQLSDATWRDAEPPALLCVPVGSCEQHGPHLPLATDTIIAAALARALADRRSDCIVAPALTIGASGEHDGFAGTLSIGNAAMADVVIELARSAGWARAVVFVNGHGGNAAAMTRAAQTLDRESRKILVWWPRVAGGDPHAGHVETSLMLALAPDAVRLDRAVAGPVPEIAELVRSGVLASSPSGVLGDPTTASPKDGERLLALLVGQLTEAVERWVEQ